MSVFSLILLSIITPAFNSAQWLESCIINASNPDTEEIEHLVIDGGSSDGSVEILQRLEKKFHRLKWISEPDSGQSNAMNKGLALAKGKWIGILNADDFYEESTLSRILDIIRRSDDKEKLIVGNLKVIDELNNLISLNRPSSMSLAKMLADICEWPYNPSAYFYHKSVHKKIGSFDENEHHAMDYDFFFRVMMARIPVEYHNETWGNFRMQPEAKTVLDQATGQAYIRASKIRKKYFLQANTKLKLKVNLLSVYWAIRNKIYGLQQRTEKSTKGIIEF